MKILNFPVSNCQTNNMYNQMKECVFLTLVVWRSVSSIVAFLGSL